MKAPISNPVSAAAAPIAASFRSTKAADPTNAPRPTDATPDATRPNDDFSPETLLPAAAIRPARTAPPVARASSLYLPELPIKADNAPAAATEKNREGTDCLPSFLIAFTTLPPTATTAVSPPANARGMFPVEIAYAVDPKMAAYASVNTREA